MRRIAFINEKGGSCKTTLAVNTAAYFASKRRARVLLVDMDPQGQAGKSLGLPVRELHPTIADLLRDDELPWTAALRPSHVPGLDVLPANKTLADFPLVVANRPDRESRLASLLETVDAGAYDFVLIDSPPSLGLVHTNILLAVEEVVVPVNLTYFALDGCAEIVESVERVQQEYGRRELAITLVVPTLYRPTRLADEIIDKLKSYFPGRCARTVIGYNVKVDEAQSHGKTIWEYAGWSRGAHMLESLAKEIWSARA